MGRIAPTATRLAALRMARQRTLAGTIMQAMTTQVMVTPAMAGTTMTTTGGTITTTLPARVVAYWASPLY